MSSAINIINNTYVNKHPKDVARFLENLDKDKAAQFLSTFSLPTILTVWYFLTPINKELFFLNFSTDVSVNILKSIDVAPAAALLSRLSIKQQEKYLEQLDKNYADYIRNYMSYPEDVAGSMMDKVTHTYDENMTVAKALSQIKKNKLTPSLYIYIVDNEMKLCGRINLQKLIVADDNDVLSAIATASTFSLNVLSPKKEIVETFEKYKSDSLPVVDSQNHMIGIIYATKLIDTIKEDVTSDIQTMVGASADEKALSTSTFAVRKRLPWLFVNLLTAFAAASVVGLFESLIAKFTALAVLLPVVAGQSGNAGAQALAVTMRGLALRELTMSHWLKVVIKETFAGSISGISIAIICATIVYLWSHSIGLAIVLAISMTLSVAIACISGAIVPMFLKKIGQDPAQSSSIILTTITDISGFFSFLGIALLLSNFI